MATQRRARRARKSAAVWSFHMDFLLSTGGETPLYPGGPYAISDEELCAGWEMFKDHILDRGGELPWAYWYCSPELPDGLRPERPRFHLADTGDERRWEAAEADKRDRARLWLREHRARDVARS